MSLAALGGKVTKPKEIPGKLKQFLSQDDTFKIVGDQGLKRSYQYQPNKSSNILVYMNQPKSSKILVSSPPALRLIASLHHTTTTTLPPHYYRVQLYPS
eukprot:162499-Pyramimonas_sp.AAC.1